MIAFLGAAGSKRRLYLSLTAASVAATAGCIPVAEAAPIEGTWACTTTNHLNGQKNEDRFVFGPANTLLMDGAMQMHGTYELADKAITLTILKIPDMARLGRSPDVRHVIKGTISALSETELAFDSTNEKGTRRTSACTRSTPTSDQHGSPQQLASPAQNPMPALPPKAANPRPMSTATAFPNLAPRRELGIFELIGTTQGLEEQINALTKDKSSVFFWRLTGPGEDVVSAGAGGVFGTACMAHSCMDSAALYVRDNGAVAVAYIDTNSDELYYFSNIDQKEGIPERIRLYVEKAMKEFPGLTLHGIRTTNGIVKVPTKLPDTSPTIEARPQTNQ